MKIEFYDYFIKTYNKRVSHNKQLSNRYKERIILFAENANNPILRNHKIRD